MGEKIQSVSILDTGERQHEIYEQMLTGYNDDWFPLAVQYEQSLTKIVFICHCHPAIGIKSRLECYV